MSEALSRDALLAASKREYHDVEVKGVGTVRVQTLNDLEHSDITSSLIDKDGNIDRTRMPHMRRIVASKMMVDADGNRMFATAEEAGELRHDIVAAVYRKKLELDDGGLTKEVKQQKKD